MDNKVFKFEFHGRRKLSSPRKKTGYIGGAVLILFGIIGLVKFGLELNTFSLILILGGVLNVAHAFWGRELMKEKNFLSFNGEEIEYKNSFKKPRIIKADDLMGIRIEAAKVEFVHNDQRVESYDFSVFPEEDIDSIHEELKAIKLKLP